jgi:hypothetical protein
MAAESAVGSVGGRMEPRSGGNAWGAYGRLGGWDLQPQQLEGERCALLDIQVIPILEDSGSLAYSGSGVAQGACSGLC